MDKADFIISLLDNKKLNPEQRLKVLELTKRDYASTEGRIAEILERIQHIEKQVGLNAEPVHGGHKVNLNEVLDEDDFFEGIDFDNILFPEPLIKDNKTLRTRRRSETNKKQKLTLKDIQEPSDGNDETDAPQVEGGVTSKVEINEKYIKYINPVHLYKYLYNYNQNPILKSTCHAIDSNEIKKICEYCKIEQYDFEHHLKKIIEAFEAHGKSFYVSPNIATRIKVYLTGKDFKNKVPELGWSTDSISLNWSSNEIKEWAQKNAGVPPNIDHGYRDAIRKAGFEISPSLILNNEKIIQNFTDLVIFFKYSFHIRRDNTLKDIILNENKRKGWDKIIKFEIDNNDFPKKVDFFTDVDKLIQAYNDIIEIILEVDKDEGKIDHTKVELALSENEVENCIDFSINHLGSIYGKSVTSFKDRPRGTKYNDLIEKKINGMCHLILEADFECGNSFRVGIWDEYSDKSKNKTLEREFVKLDAPVGGVKHIFKILKGK